MQTSVKQDREKWIGGSDIPAIMGISPFATRYELLLLKAGIKEGTFEGNEYTEYGNIMEPKIREYINKDTEDKFKETKYEYRATGVRCHLDGENSESVLEIKTTSQIHQRLEDYKVYLVQLLFYMYNVGKEKGILAVYERPNDFNEEFDPERLKTYNIDINNYEELIEEINYEVSRFKEDVTKMKENPLLSEEDLLPNTVQELSKQVLQIEKQLETYKQLEKQQKELKQKLYEAMINTGTKGWETPNGTIITLVKPTEDKTEMVLNEERLKEEQPILYATYCEEKIKKGKSGYIRITTGEK